MADALRALALSLGSVAASFGRYSAALAPAAFLVSPPPPFFPSELRQRAPHQQQVRFGAAAAFLAEVVSLFSPFGVGRLL